MAVKKPNWLKIRAAYEAGEGSYRELAAKFKVPFPTLRDRAIREKWAEGRNGVRNRAVPKIQEKLAETVASKIVSDLDVIDGLIASGLDKLPYVEPKSYEGLMNAILRAIEVKQDIAKPDLDQTPMLVVEFANGTADQINNTSNANLATSS